MTVPAYSHVLFGDESHHNTGRYRSVGVVTAERGAGLALHRWYKEVLDEHPVSSLEFKKLNDRKVLPAAQRVFSGLVRRLQEGSARIDILVWDAEDRRHAIPGRDDRANLRRMYYHCIRTCLDRRWPDDVFWRVFLDEDAIASVDDFQRILQGRTLLPAERHALFGTDLCYRRTYRIRSVESVTTNEQPLLHLADLLAGLAVVSRREHAQFKAWRDSASGQMGIFGDPDLNTSNRASNQFTLIQHLREVAGEASLGLSLDSTGGLETRDPCNPLNFWFYRPQHESDKAPRRGER